MPRPNPKPTRAELPLVYQEIADRLRQQVGEQWPPGTRLPPIKELADRMGTGQSNTQRAVRALVEEGLLVSVPRRGTHVRSRVDAGPSAGRSGRAKAVAAVILRSSPDVFMDPAIEAITAHLARHRLQVTTQTIDWRQKARSLEQYAQADALVLINPRPDGPVMLGPRQDVVVLATRPEGIDVRARGYDLVGADGRQGAYLAGQRLRGTGVRQVIFLGVRRGAGAGQWDEASALRLRGLEEGWGRRLSESTMLSAAGYTAEFGAAAVPDFLRFSPRPDGIFCASDDLALGFVRGALAHHLSPGQDYQIIGFDGVDRGKRLICGSLSTVEAPMARMGQAAAEFLVERVAQPSLPTRRVYLACTLFPGQTARRTQQ